MIGTASSTVGTAGIVAMSFWTDDKPITIKFVVGVGILAVSLAMLGEVNDRLAEQFGALILLTAILLYGPKIAQGLGLTKGGGPFGNAADAVSRAVGAS